MKRAAMISLSVLMALLFVLLSEICGWENLIRAEHAEQSGTISIALEDAITPGASKAGVHFSLYKTADISSTGEIRPIAPFDQTAIDYEQKSGMEQWQKAADEMAALAAQTLPVCTLITSQYGTAQSSLLTPGIYLLKVDDPADYDNMLPALIRIPAWSEQSGSVIWNVTVYPKHSMKKDELVQIPSEESSMPSLSVQPPQTDARMKASKIMAVIAASAGIFSLMVLFRHYRCGK